MHSLLVALLLAVCFVSTCYGKNKLKKHHVTHHHHESTYCFSEEELENSPSEVVHHFVSSRIHWERYSAVNLVPYLEEAEKRRKRRKRSTSSTCPKIEDIVNGRTLNERSISPWTYRIDTDETRFPQKLAFAKCLCNYCVSESGAQMTSLNSVTVNQTMLVLRKKNCQHIPSLKTFTLEYITVPVACTCSAPRYA